MAAGDGVVDKLVEYMEYEKDEGRTHVEISPRAQSADDGTGEGTSVEAGPGVEQIAKQVAGCTKCPLHAGRTNTVPGQGSATPEIMFIGEAPGHDEDLQGLAFVGKAGKLLTKMINAMGLEREDVFIGNILKCRPPENRAPLPEEMTACMPYLRAQIAALKPKVIVTLGGTASKSLLDITIGITKFRGQWKVFEGIDTMPTYHPAYLLRSPSAKKDAWADLQEVLKRIGREVPAR